VWKVVATSDSCGRQQQRPVFRPRCTLERSRVDWLDNLERILEISNANPDQGVGDCSPEIPLLHRAARSRGRHHGHRSTR
jgi:hypothetical protein